MNSYSALESSTSPEMGGLDYDDFRKQPRVTTTERDSIVDETEERRQSLQESIGRARMSIIVLGTIFILAAVAVLAFLWKGAAIAASQADPGRTWQSLIDRGWASITVTICAAVIRTAVSLQAGVVMSMVASVLLEKHTVRFRDAAFLSIVRAVSVQPATMLLTGGRGVLKSSGLFWFPMVMFAAIIALASTFTSTILLSDFSNINIVGKVETTIVGYTNQSSASRLDLFRSPPLPYARFAEYTNATRAVGPNIDDTGLTLRVPLPLPDSRDRSTLRTYNGPATVFDNRVICVAPKLTLTSILETWGNTAGSLTGQYLALTGSASFESDLPAPLRGAKPATQVPFACQLPDGGLAPGLKWNMTVCTVMFNISRRYQPPIGITPFLPIWPQPNIEGYRPNVFFIFNVTQPRRPSGTGWTDVVGLVEANDNETFVFPPASVVTTADGPWTRAKISGVQEFIDAEFSVSGCISSYTGTPLNVSLTSSYDGPEPTMGWTGALSVEKQESIPNFAYDTSDVRKQLDVSGLSSKTPAERGIMDLDFSATDWANQAPDISNFPLGSLGLSSLFPTFAFSGVPLTQPPNLEHGTATNPSAVMSYGFGPDLGHPGHVTLFHDALYATKSPARALQAWLTTLMRQNYYDTQPRFTAGAEATFSRSVAVFAPSRWAGLAGILAVVTVHLAVVLAATVWFMRETRHSVLGQSWMAVAQVVSEATAPVLLQADSLKDGQVEQLMRRETGIVDAQRYGVVRPRRTGRRELVAM